MADRNIVVDRGSVRRVSSIVTKLERREKRRPAELLENCTASKRLATTCPVNRHLGAILKRSNFPSVAPHRSSAAGRWIADEIFRSSESAVNPTRLLPPFPLLPLDYQPDYKSLYLPGPIDHNQTIPSEILRDPEVRKLADAIIEAQVREIAEMKRMVARRDARRQFAGGGPAAEQMVSICPPHGFDLKPAKIERLI